MVLSLDSTLLEKPAVVNSVTVAGENDQLAATWIVPTPAADENKTATSFVVSLYSVDWPDVPLTTINTANQHYTFTRLSNGVGYRVGVKAKNDAGSSSEVISGVGTPTVPTFRPPYTSNKRVCGVNQNVAPGLSATQNMILRRKHSGVKSVMLLDCCGYSVACTTGSQSKCPSQCKTYNFNINCSL
jgi:hypothetical protein